MFSSLNSPPKLYSQKTNYSKDHIPKPVSLSSHYHLFQFEMNTVSLIPLIILVCKDFKNHVCPLPHKWLVFCPPHYMGMYMFSECKCYQQCIKSTAFWCETISIYKEKVISYQLELGNWCFDWMVPSSSTECSSCPDDNCSIQSKCRQVIFWAQVGNR